MPRPGRRTEARNPITALFEERKLRKEELEKQAAQQITDDMAGNEQKMLDLLESINFSKSPIPREELDKKSREDQPCGDLEYGVRAAFHDIKKNSIQVRADLRPIDEKILCLIAYLKQSVRFGDLEAANAAKAALLRSLKEIRDKVPEVMPEKIPKFIEQNIKYLDEWITLVQMAEYMDGLKTVVGQQEQNYQSEKERYDQSITDFKKSLANDPIKAGAAKELKNSVTKEDEENWSSAAQDLHEELIGQGMERAVINVKETLYRSNKKKLQITSEQVEILKAKLNSVNPIKDENLIAEYEDAIKDMVKDINRSDIELKKSLDAMETLDAQLRNLQNGEGNTRYRMLARKALNKTLQELQERENAQIEQVDPNGGCLHDLGLHSDEEIAEARERNRQEQERIDQQYSEENQNQNGDQLLYN